MKQSTIYANIRRLRETKGLTQILAADRAGVSRTTYNNIEKGNIKNPRLSTLQKIADVLEVKLEDLLGPVRILKKVRFRSSKIRSRNSILTEVTRWLDDFNELEILLNYREDYLFENLTQELSIMINGLDRAKYAAERARDILKLSYKEPIYDIVGLLESSGIKVYPITLWSYNFLGLSVAKEEVGPAIIVNVWNRISVEQWIFSAVHELGHLLLHSDTFDINEIAENEDQEAEANIFASYFLMPEKAFKSEWDNTYGLPFVDRVLKVKLIFGVSYSTILYRLSIFNSFGNCVWAKFQSSYKLRTGKTLHIKDEPEAFLQDEFLQAPIVMLSQEPHSISPSHFVEGRLYRLVSLAIEKNKITMSRGAEILKIDFAAMRDIVS